MHRCCGFRTNVLGLLLLGWNRVAITTLLLRITCGAATLAADAVAATGLHLHIFQPLLVLSTESLDSGTIPGAEHCRADSPLRIQFPRAVLFVAHPISPRSPFWHRYALHLTVPHRTIGRVSWIPLLFSPNPVAPNRRRASFLSRSPFRFRNAPFRLFPTEEFSFCRVLWFMALSPPNAVAPIRRRVLSFFLNALPTIFRTETSACRDVVGSLQPDQSTFCCWYRCRHCHLFRTERSIHCFEFWRCRADPPSSHAVAPNGTTYRTSWISALSPPNAVTPILRRCIAAA